MNSSLSLTPDYVASIFGFEITNTFLVSLLVSLLLMLLSIYYYLNRGNNKNFILRAIYSLVVGMFRFTDNLSGNRNITKQVFPLIATLFLFIATCNLISLFPGFLGSFQVISGGKYLPVLRSPNSDLTTTLGLTIVTVISIQIITLKNIGLGGYVGQYINFSSFSKFFVGLFELVSELAKVISYSFRLFGNILAGEIILILLTSFTPFIFPLPVLIFEVFIGLIQAFIFSALTVSFIKSKLVSFSELAH